MTHPRLYIAGPYTQGDVVLNVRAAVQAAERAIQLGWTPYIPHLTHLWHLISPHPIDFWYQHDLEWLRACQALLRLPGESKGVDREVEEAVKSGIPVFDGMDSLIEGKVFQEQMEELKEIFGERKCH